MKYNYSELLETEWDMLKTHILTYKPKKILEIGVSYGGTTNLLLNTLDKSQELYSIDISTNSKIASQVKKKDNWYFFQGKTLINFNEILENYFDLVILDTAHVLPGEILDFLMVYPLMKKESFLALHDISLFLKSDEKQSFSPFLLLSCLSQNEKTFSNTDFFSNFTLIKINKTENITSLINLLLMDWEDYRQIEDIKKLLDYFNKNYLKSDVELFYKIYKYQINKRIKNVIKNKLGNK